MQNKHKYKTVLIAGILSFTMICSQGCGLPFFNKTDSAAENQESAAEQTEESEEVSIEEAVSESSAAEEQEENTGEEENSSESANIAEPDDPAETEENAEESEIPVITPEPIVQKEDEEISFDPTWTYGEFSKINSGTAMLYYAPSDIAKNITVCINAGHGTQGGSSVKTQCHPDGTPKVTGGTTNAGETYAVAVSTGMDFADGTPERKVTLALSLVVKDKLLEAGYNVLMTRIDDDVQLDNIARTLIANHYADCHIAIHYDSTSSDKGAYYMSVPDVSSYRAMEPVASHWEEHNRLGDSVIEGLREAGAKVMGSGSIEMDLTQTSYSTVPSIDLECGDKVSDRSEETLNTLAEGILKGLDIFFEQFSPNASSGEASDESFSEETEENSGETGENSEETGEDSEKTEENSDEDNEASDGIAE